MHLRRYITLALALVAWNGFDRFLKHRIASPAKQRRSDSVTDRDIERDLRNTGDDGPAPAPAGVFLGDPTEVSTVGLVAAERELLTVDGEDGHRRRDQTAGAAARELAAAQVRARRYGTDDEL